MLPPHTMQQAYIHNIHTSQMPISAQQWRVAVGQVNASQSIWPCISRQPKRKMTAMGIFLFFLTALLGAILLLGNGGMGTGQMSECSEI